MRTYYVSCYKRGNRTTRPDFTKCCSYTSEEEYINHLLILRRCYDKITVLKDSSHGTIMLTDSDVTEYLLRNIPRSNYFDIMGYSLMEV